MGGDTDVGKDENCIDLMGQDLIGMPKVHQSLVLTQGYSVADKPGSSSGIKANTAGDHSGRKGGKNLGDMRTGSADPNAINGPPQRADLANGTCRRLIGGQQRGTPIRDNMSSGSSEKTGTTSILDSPVTNNIDSGHKFRIRNKTRDKTPILDPKNRNF